MCRRVVSRLVQGLFDKEPGDQGHLSQFLRAQEAVHD